VATANLSKGEILAALSGVLLFLFMFLPWYGNAGEAFSGSGSFNAWQSLSFIDLLLFVVCVIAVAFTLLRPSGVFSGLPWSPAAVVAVAGSVAVVLIVFRIVAAPVDEVVGFEINVGRRIGIFLALLAAGGIAFGGYTAMSETATPARRSRPRTPGT